MNKINVLLVVDVAGVLAAGGLQGSVYIVDTNGYLGSWDEGQSALNTVCQDGQRVSWAVAPVDASTAVSITGFSGALVDQKICTPAPDPFQGTAVWNGQVEAHGAFAGYPYAVQLAMSGAQMSAPAVLKVV